MTQIVTSPLVPDAAGSTADADALQPAPAAADDATTAPGSKRGITVRNLDWTIVIFIGILHVGCLAAPFTFSWTGLVWFLLLVWLSGGVGITLCFHRLLTHRSFETPKWFEYLITVIGCIAWQGSPRQWVGTHRIHHKHSDEEADPHTPNHGFTWAHILWTLHREPDGQNAKAAAKDLDRDRVHRIIEKLNLIPQVLLAIFLLVAGQIVGRFWLDAPWLGVSWLVWGICLRTVLVYHGTWFVNSATHTWGYRNYETKDNSTNLWWVAVVSFGEGWHNNHHQVQRSAAHGLRWFEFDLTWWTIKALSRVGLAKNIVLPKPEEMPK